MSRLPVAIRRAASTDLGDVLELWAASRDEGTARTARGVVNAETLNARMTEALQREDIEVLLALRDDRPVGLLIVRETPGPLLGGGPNLVIDAIYVVPAERRHGIARLLLAQVAGQAERSACEQIVSSATPGARETHRFLARLGFAPLTVSRGVSPGLLRRRLAGESRGALDDLLSRRRSLRARNPVDPLDPPGRLA